MKITFRMLLLLSLLLFNVNRSEAQNEVLTTSYKEQAIQSLSQLMNDFYVFPEVAKKTADHLKNQLDNGYYDEFNTNESFADALTEAVQSVNHDKHMRIRVNRPFVAPPNTPERIVEEQVVRMNRSRQGNYGFQTVDILEGNVGYLDLRGFAGLENAKETADAAMKLLSRTDAIIFDLSKNGGGSPEMVQYLCSFFFDKTLHLNSLYWREGNVTREFWTLDSVSGTKLPDVPLFIITSNRTFSAAEEFSYNMQTQKRATLVGQTTGGGANPGGTMGINNNLTVFIPTGKAINPITKTNWEGVGVVPEIKTTAEESLNKTKLLAKEAAENFRNKTKERFSVLYLDLTHQLDNFTNETSENEILESIKECQEKNVLDEDSINSLGYQYLMTHNKPNAAQIVFKANTMLYPNSANVYDSYAETLMINGDKHASVENYQKAISVATEYEDGNLELFKKNLEAAKSKLNE